MLVSPYYRLVMTIGFRQFLSEFAVNLLNALRKSISTRELTGDNRIGPKFGLHCVDILDELMTAYVLLAREMCNAHCDNGPKSVPSQLIACFQSAAVCLMLLVREGLRLSMTTSRPRTLLIALS